MTFSPRVAYGQTKGTFLFGVQVYETVPQLVLQSNNDTNNDSLNNN